MPISIGLIDGGIRIPSVPDAPVVAARLHRRHRGEATSSRRSTWT
jgi:hypothetical protein